MMHRIFLRSLLPFPLFFVAACGEPLHVGDVDPPPPAAAECTDQWAKKLGDDPNDVSIAHTVDAAGNIFLAGSFLGSFDLGAGALTSAGDRDIVVARLTSAGALVWSKRFGDEQQQRAVSVATDGDGNVLVTGVARGTVDFGGGPRTAQGDGEAFLVKLDPAGNHLWSKLLGGGAATFDDNLGGPSVSADAQGGIVISGRVDGDLDLDGTKQTLPAGSFAAKLDSGGALVWQRSFGDADIEATSNRKGDVALTGTFNGTFTLGGDSSPVPSGSPGRHIVVHLDDQGHEIYKLVYGGQDAQDRGVIDETGSITIAGSSGINPEDSFFLGSALVNARQTYVVKLEPSGVVAYNRAGNDRTFSYALPYALTAVEGDSSGSSTFVVGEFHRMDSSPLDQDTSAAADGVPDFAGCPADDGSSIFVVGLGPQGDLTSCRLFAQSGYGPFAPPTNVLSPRTITAGGEGRLLLSGAFKGTTTLDCATLDAPPVELADPAPRWPGFLAKIAR